MSQLTWTLLAYDLRCLEFEEYKNHEDFHEEYKEILFIDFNCQQNVYIKSFYTILS